MPIGVHLGDRKPDHQSAHQQRSPVDSRRVRIGIAPSAVSASRPITIGVVAVWIIAGAVAIRIVAAAIAVWVVGAAIAIGVVAAVVGIVRGGGVYRWRRVSGCR